MTARRPLCVLHWHRERPYRLTALAIAADRLAQAEQRASAVLAGLVLPPSWTDAPPEFRRRVVRDCRAVPVEAVWHLVDERPHPGETDSWSRCVTQTLQEWPGPGPDDDGWDVVLDGSPTAFLEVFSRPGEGKAREVAAEAWPGLRSLARLTSLACQAIPGAEVDQEEDLLSIYHQYSVGALVEQPPTLL